MSRALRALAAQWLAAGRAAVVVEVAQAQGSTPRETGARMLVAADDTAGSIGGGHLEWQAVAHARALLAGAAVAETQRLALGPALGQCCGGVVELRYARLDAAALAAWPAPAPQLQVAMFGAGHVGRAIATVLATLDAELVWVDERAEAFGAGPWPPHWQLIATDDAVAEVAQLPASGHALVLTHSHTLDLELVAALLTRGAPPWLGLIGSASKRARFAVRLAAQGFSAETIARIHCPIGVPGITGKAPEVIAVAVCAQLLATASPGQLKENS